MKKRVAVVILVMSLLGVMAAVASAEHDNAGGVGVNSTGNVRIMERGDKGGVGVNENGPIWPFDRVRTTEHDRVGGVGVR